MSIRVMLVDDHAVVRQGLGAILNAQDDIEIVGEADTAEQAVWRAGFDKPDVIIMDVQLPDATGIDACREIRSQFPDINVVMLTSFADDEALHSAVLAGAAGFLLKRIQPDELIDGIRRAAAGESLLAQDVVDAAFARLRGDTTGDDLLDRLTPQERKVLALIEQGMTNRQIGEELYLAEKTVKNYVSNMLAKLGMARRSEAAAYAARHRAEHEQRFPAGDWDELDD